jgi:hypothetical protein
MNIKASKKLEAAGNAVLRAAETASHASVAPTTVEVLQVQPPAPQQIENAGPSLSERLREINQMHDEGLIDEAEFTQLRAKLLGSI